MATLRTAVLFRGLEAAAFAAAVKEFEEELEEHGDEDRQGAEGQAAGVEEYAAPEGFADVGLVFEGGFGVAEIPVRSG